MYVMASSRIIGIAQSVCRLRAFPIPGFRQGYSAQLTLKGPVARDCIVKLKWRRSVFSWHLTYTKTCPNNGAGAIEAPRLGHTPACGGGARPSAAQSSEAVRWGEAVMFKPVGILANERPRKARSSPWIQ